MALLFRQKQPLIVYTTCLNVLSASIPREITFKSPIKYQQLLIRAKDVYLIWSIQPTNQLLTFVSRQKETAKLLAKPPFSLLTCIKMALHKHVAKFLTRLNIYQL